jgi:hypothetical protein
LGFVLVLALACGAPSVPGQSRAQPANEFRVFTSKAEADGKEAVCAWYGDARDGILYFGEAAFWSGLRATGSPLGELDHSGPRRIGRFDLRRGRMLPALLLAPKVRSGTWDVLAHPNGRIYFTTFFDGAGSVDPATGEIEQFVDAGTGLNEWGLGPDKTLFVSRYAGDAGTSGSLVWFNADGTLRKEFPLKAQNGSVLAPKTVAYDPETRLVWITSDILPNAPGAAGHPTLIVDLAGREQERISDLEIQFVRFGADGTGYLALVEENKLQLAILPPGTPADRLGQARRITLDDAFPSSLDFAQNIRVEGPGQVLVTTWGGQIFVVEPSAPEPVRPFAFPRLADGGLYYSAASDQDRLCATYCAESTVVCTELD